MKIVWNYDDAEVGLLGVMYEGKYLGYFQMKTNIFVYMDRYDYNDKAHDSMHISLLKQIAAEYDEALNTAKKLMKI